MLKPKSKDYSDSILWQEIKSGDEYSFASLFKKYYSELVTYCRNTANVNKEFAEDCVQDVFSDLWKYRKNISESISVKPYLFTSLRNRIIKNKKKLRFTTIDGINNIHFDSFINNELIELTDEQFLKQSKLKKIINDLPKKQKEIIYLCYIHDLNIHQASKILSINYQSAKNLIFRTLTSIRKKMSILSFL